MSRPSLASALNASRTGVRPSASRVDRLRSEKRFVGGELAGDDEVAEQGIGAVAVEGGDGHN